MDASPDKPLRPDTTDVPPEPGSGEASPPLGVQGEDCACHFLEDLGFIIRARNYRGPGGEIDVVAQAPADALAPLCPGEFVFCEVKTRRYHRDAEPMLEAVPRAKQRKLAETAVRYCQEHRITPHMRFDVIAVAPDATGAPRVVAHVPHAFTCEGLGLFF